MGRFGTPLLGSFNVCCFFWKKNLSQSVCLYIRQESRHAYLYFYPSVCLNMRMYVSFSLPVCKSACMKVLPVPAYAHSSFYQFFCLSVHAHVCTKASVNAHPVVSRDAYLLLNLHLHLTYALANLCRLT